MKKILGIDTKLDLAYLYVKVESSSCAELMSHVTRVAYHCQVLLKIIKDSRHRTNSRNLSASFDEP
jgi:hypothetical protein